VSNVLSYKGYAAVVVFDAEDETFVGRLAGINDVVGFHTDTAGAIKAAFREAVDDYLATCAKVGKKAEKPYSGKVMVRIDPQVHATAALAAQVSGKSLAQWAEEKLRDGAAQDLRKAVPA
jgi:predicted HicB family RNase H-like nuclease